MRILVCNDDGVNAPGLQVMQRIAETLSDDIWVVAPTQEQSGAGRSLSLTRPLRLHRLDERRFAVDGTPTDCVMVAVREVLDTRPDLLLSGVNRGANLAEDIAYSGTVAAAMEGALLGIPSIAMSQAGRHGDEIKWQTAAHFGPDIIRKLIASGWPEDVLINVNFPNIEPTEISGIHAVPHGRRDQRDVSLDKGVDGRNMPYYWLGMRQQTGTPPPDADIGVIWRGGISVTPISLNVTDPDALKLATRIFAE